jgi:glycolate oxidase FAD binding subunit
VPLYEPSELTLVALAGTPVAQLERLLAENDQEFPFEPLDLGPVLGFGPGQATIGGLIATNFSGSRRILRGSARDHLLGVQAVNGQGEAIRAGGRVMKNVTGYDLPRALAGSWGTLAVMTEVALKVLPAPREVRTVLCFGLADQIGVEALCLAQGTPFEVSGTIHMHAALAERLSDQEIANAGAAVTAIRVENFPASARYRSSRLKQMLQAFAPALELDTMRSRAFWDDVKTLKMFQKPNLPLWRISTLPSEAPKLVLSLSRKIDVRVMYDWSGGLIWLETPPISDAGAVEIRRTLAEIGGHATLIRAEAASRAQIDVFQPLDAGLMALTAAVKKAFDPVGILNPGRMYAGI